ncbi:glutamate--cysteine ligase [Actinocorallia libanotica]|uniref:Putative glutamate--cysteine ligase 2 n=1 Tax=Actinocorallia libanotica TaxID=46162 RepID=A0ABN1Q6P6_9ACTN
MTVGVEEEFLLVDSVSGGTAARASAVLGRLRPADAATGAGFHRELLATQVESATGVCTELDELRRQLTEGRLALAAAARAEGLRLVASGTAVLPCPDPPAAEGSRFTRITDVYAAVVRGYQCCGCHVHVGVPDRETAVAVLNHLAPWLPTLLALSANSPFHQGRDTDYASWRMVEQTRFPGSGITPFFRSAADYDRRIERLVECGALIDENMTFWLARLSPTYPTVEVRAADVGARVDDAVLQAALTRALVDHALAELAEGREAPRLNEQLCAAAVWSAARYGLDGQGVDLRKEHPVPASELVAELFAVVRPFLEQNGDLAAVQAALANLLAEGNGASRQRAAASGGLRAVVDALAEHTSPTPLLSAKGAS